MSLSVSLPKVLAVFGNTFESIDLKTAAVFHEGQWRNVLSVFRFSYEPAENVKDKHVELQRIFGKINGDAFRFYFDVVPFAKVQEIISGIQSDAFNIRGDRVLIGETEAFDSQLETIDRGGSGEWSKYRFSYGRFQYQPLVDRKVVEEAHSYGASGPEEILNALFEEQLFGGGHPSRSVFFHVPIYVRTTDFGFDGTGMYVVTEHHRNVNLEPKILLLRNDGGRFTPTKAITIEGKNSEPLFEEKQLLRTCYQAPRPSGVGTWIGVGVSSPGIGEIQKDSRAIQTLLPLEETSPLYAALQRFCSRADFTEELLRAHERQPGKLKVSSAFELRVSWLLSLIGLTPVVLGEYERLFAVNTDFHHGSVDILAMNPATRTLFVIDCTLVVPPAHDYSKVLTAKSVLKNEVLPQNAHIQAVLFTNTRDVAASDEFGKTRDVVVIDGNRMERILEMLGSGQQARVLAYFENPGWSIF